MTFPALAILEMSSIARGMVVGDALVKRAPVTILQSTPVSSGKHLLIFAGAVAEVEESYAAGIEVAGAALVDSLYLPAIAEQLPPLLDRHAKTSSAPADDAVAIFESDTVCTAVLGADAAAKAAAIRVLELRLAAGIGGKAFFTMVGELAEIEAGLAAAIYVADPARVVATEIIAAPHADLRF
jgi:microcompartment protein CcmL/EutN